MVEPVGQPGVNPEKDVSVPINWAYNHHYMTWMTGKHSALKKVRVSPEEKAAHASEFKWIDVDTVDRQTETPHPTIPTSHFFSEGNGGESRKSFHGYPSGYAQLLQSPQTWHITPMQIDTRNRDCGVTPADIHNCTHGKDGYPAFTPGPEPLQARYGLGIPAKGTNYSGVLECPCNSRYGGSSLIYPTVNSSKTKEKIPSFQTQMTNCNKNTIFTSAKYCFEAVSKIHVHNVVANTTVSNNKHPLGCSVLYDSKNSAATVYFNSGPTNSVLAVAAPPSCPNNGTLYTGETKSLIGVEVRVDIDTTKGPITFTSSGKGKYCSNNRKFIPSKYYIYIFFLFSDKFF
jgi:hypothetical protein